MLPTLLLSAALGDTFHVDPETGSMANSGSASDPWSTLEDVFSTNPSFGAGDEILLYSGYHGAPTVRGNNSANVFIRPAEGEEPLLKTLTVKSGSRWVIERLDICPEHESAGTTTGASLVEIESSASRITLNDCLIRSAFSTDAWTLSDWKTKPTRAIRTAGPYSMISNNRVIVANYPLTVRKTATFSVATGNHFKGFSHDGILALADDCLFEYNTVTDAYISDNAHNHDDFLQSWSTGGDSGYVVGEGTVSRVTVRGNTFISQTDSNQPFPAKPQGVGCFDGYYEDWLVENNVIVTGTYHGISLYGAINCKVVNNTVVENPLDSADNDLRPWILIEDHKTRNDPATGNLVRNNISAQPVDVVPGSSIVDHNQTTTDYSAYFTNHEEFDFSLNPDSPAVDSGNSEAAPLIDILGVNRSEPYDIGAYSFQAAAGQTYAQWLEENDLPADASGDGSPNASPAGDGVTNEMKFALGLPVDSEGYEGRVTTAITPDDGQDYLTLTYIRPETPPVGVSYDVESGANLASWESGVEVSTSSANGLRTVVVRDSVPMGASSPQRFIRLAVEGL